MEAALNFCLLFFQEKRKKKSVALWRFRRLRITSFRGCGTAMTAWDVSVSLRTKAKLPDTVRGNAKTPTGVGARVRPPGGEAPARDG